MNQNNNLKKFAFSVLPLIDNFDFEYLQTLKNIGLKYIHYDVMDEFTGTRGFDSKHLSVLNLLDFKVNVHLMVDKISTTLIKFKEQPATGMSFHVESLQNIQDGIEFLTFIKNQNKKAGISFKLNTDLWYYKELIQHADYVTLMSVEPGKGGQEFDSNVLKNISTLLTICKKYNFKIPEIEFDGGITDKQIKLLWNFGNYFVSGSWFHNLNLEQKEKLLNEFKN